MGETSTACLQLGEKLLSDGTSGSDSGRVFSGSSVDNGGDQDLRLNSRYFDGVLSGHQFDDFEGLFDHSDGEAFFTGVSAVEHEAVNESFHDGALGLRYSNSYLF